MTVPDAEHLREWMYNFIVDHTGEDGTFHNLLEREISRWDETLPLNGPELDRAEIFKELVDALASILGSENAAGEWLTHSSIFKKYGGVRPLMYLEGGGFWSMSLLNDVLLIAKALPMDPLGLRSDLLRDTYQTKSHSAMHVTVISRRQRTVRYQVVSGRKPLPFRLS